MIWKHIAPYALTFTAGAQYAIGSTIGVIGFLTAAMLFLIAIHLENRKKRGGYIKISGANNTFINVGAAPPKDES